MPAQQMLYRQFLTLSIKQLSNIKINNILKQAHTFCTVTSQKVYLCSITLNLLRHLMYIYMNLFFTCFLFTYFCPIALFLIMQLECPYFFTSILFYFNTSFTFSSNWASFSSVVSVAFHIFMALSPSYLGIRCI